MMRREGKPGTHSSSPSNRRGKPLAQEAGQESRSRRIAPLALIFTLILLAAGLAHQDQRGPTPTRTSFIVQGDHFEQTQRAVIEVGGLLTHELPIVHGVAADLTESQAEALRKAPGAYRLHENSSVQAAWDGALSFDASADSDIAHANPGNDDGINHGEGTSQQRPYTDFPRRVRAHLLHAGGLTGAGVTVAIIDSGIDSKRALMRNSQGDSRLLASYNARRDIEDKAPDRYGHGSHIASVLANSSKAQVETADGTRRLYNGTAPDVDLVVIKAFNKNGRGRYADVIRGIQWLLDRQQDYGVRILNLSFGAPPSSFYWDDPLNQAVMEAWSAGIFVVTAAGNDGPAPMTVTAPGNVPYVMTVGAMSDGFTPGNPHDDYLTTFTGAGPTAEGFIKPDVVAPGAHILGRIGRNNKLGLDFPERWQGNYFELSGTSQATAVVSGIAALILQAKPWLSPDELKCRLMAAAQAAVDEQGQLAYSPYQQGAGLVDAYRALNEVSGCANRGLVLRNDLYGDRHSSGPARFDEADGFHVPKVGYVWDGVYKHEGVAWGGGSPYLNGDPWIDGQGDPWIEGQGDPWIEGQGDPWIEGQSDPWIEGDPWKKGKNWKAKNPWIDSQGDPWIEGQGDPWIDTQGWTDGQVSLESILTIATELPHE